ncbi:g3316 [Coccomyxa elongata]
MQHLRDEDVGTCPHIAVSDLDSHEAAHRLQEDEDEEKKRPAERQGTADVESRHSEALQANGLTDKGPGKCRRCGKEGHWDEECPHNPHRAEALSRVVNPPTFANICAMQRPASFLQVKTGLIPLLKQALCSQGGSFRAALSGPVHHFHAASQDSGWGCGWNNIQMLASHLLLCNKELGQALFGGCGFVPDISSLQAWLACAWASGFDSAGAHQLGSVIQGTHKWVGTTEAASVFRLFGIRANVVDFKGHKSAKQQKTGHPSTTGGSSSAAEQMRPFHHGVQCDKCGVSPIVGLRYKSQVLQDYDLCGNCFALEGTEALGPFIEMASPSENSSAASQRAIDHSALLDWVWEYFTKEEDGKRASLVNLKDCLTGPVIMSGKPPLYFQHEGHSRTIVGIERSGASDGQPEQVYLLILDPSHGTAGLEKALRQRKGWQRLIKRSMCMLQKPQFQLLHCLDGLATGQELEELKIMRASQQYGF